MAILLVTRGLSKSFGPRRLFENISVTIEERDRFGLIGLNGSGKSTFLRIAAGLEEPDEGEVVLRSGVKAGYVPQEDSFRPGAKISEIFEEALDPAHLDTQELVARIHSVAGQAGFQDLSQPVEPLSGGWRKRLSIARELVREPDILLLDEPTNHLDLEGILWLEKLLTNARFASLFVSHDRYFLENVATRMAELSRVYPDGMLRADGSYSDFLEKKDAFEAAEAKRQDALASRVRREIEWLRRGPKARTTKSKARIDAANTMIGDLNASVERSRTSRAAIDFTGTERKTKRLVEVREVSKSLGGRMLFAGVEFALGPATRFGIAGWNGTGKKTLLRLLAGELAPYSGEIRRAEDLRIIYFDQKREQLDPKVSLRRSLAPDSDSVIYRDKPVHVNGWAKRFLFRTDQLELPVGELSGGERARLLIARLMLQPADLLLLDEPTNDLDLHTLEILEDSLLDFPGALALVSHDRYLMDRVCTSVLGLDGKGAATLFASHSQWEAASKEAAPAEAARKSAVDSRTASPDSKKRLSYMEQREWDSMEERITTAESLAASLRGELEDANRTGAAEAARAAYENLARAEEAVAALYERWAELEAKLPQ